MGTKHCTNLKEANRFIKGLRKRGKGDEGYKFAHIKKHKNKDGSYLVRWVSYTR